MSLTYRPQAERDLDEMWLTIALDSPKRADAYLDQLHQRCLRLSEFPRIGHPAEEVEPDIWVFPMDRYLVFYTITKDGIDIVRFWHTSRDIDNLFFEDE